MRKLIMFAGISLALSGCTALQEQTAVADIGQAAADVAAVCQAAKPVIQGATAQGSPISTTAGNLLSYANSACNADGTVAATLAPTAATPTWLEGVVMALETAAQIEPVILPLVSKPAAA